MLAEYRRENETDWVDWLPRYGMESALAHIESTRIVTNGRRAICDENMRPSDLEVTPICQSSGVNSTPDTAACQVAVNEPAIATRNSHDPVEEDVEPAAK